MGTRFGAAWSRFNEDNGSYQWNGTDNVFNSDGTVCDDPTVPARVRCLFRLACLYDHPNGGTIVSWAVDALVLLDETAANTPPIVADSPAARYVATTLWAFGTTCQSPQTPQVTLAFPGSPPRLLGVPLCEFGETSPLRTDGSTDTFEIESYPGASSQLADLLDPGRNTDSPTYRIVTALAHALATPGCRIPFPSALTANLVALSNRLGFRPGQRIVAQLRVLVDACLDAGRLRVTVADLLRLVGERRDESPLPCSPDKLVAALLADTQPFALFGATATMTARPQLLNLLTLVHPTAACWNDLAAWIDDATVAMSTWLGDDVTPIPTTSAVVGNKRKREGDGDAEMVANKFLCV